MKSMIRQRIFPSENNLEKHKKFKRIYTVQA